MKHLILRQGDANYWKYSLLPFGILLLLCLIFLLVRGCTHKEISETFCVEAEVIQGEDTTIAVDTNIPSLVMRNKNLGDRGINNLRLIWVQRAGNGICSI